MVQAGQQFVNDFHHGGVKGGVDSLPAVGRRSAVWDQLDDVVGGATTSVPFTAQALTNFEGVLAATVVTEVWAAITGGGTDDEIVHVDDFGTGAGTNATTLFTPTSTNNPTLVLDQHIALDPTR